MALQFLLTNCFEKQTKENESLTGNKETLFHKLFIHSVIDFGDFFCSLGEQIFQRASKVSKRSAYEILNATNKQGLTKKKTGKRQLFKN